LRARYEDAARQRARHRQQIFQRTRVDSISVRTDRPYINEIHRFFRMREKRYAQA
jgi:hypothetical protein